MYFDTSERDDEMKEKKEKDKRLTSFTLRNALHYL